MKKLRGLLMALGILTILGTGYSTYHMWSKNARDSAIYDLWMAGRIGTPSGEQGLRIIEAKNATRKAGLLAVTGGAFGLFLLASARWLTMEGTVQPRRMGEANV